MSKHVSRLLLTASPFRQYLPHQSFRGLRDQQVCFQHSKPKPELPLPEAGDGKKSTARGKLAVGALLIGCTAGFAWYVKNEKEMDELRKRRRALRKTAIGGKWDLIDGNGQTHHSSEFLGKWCLIYFGFTHCPDICPDEMEKLAGVISDLDKNNLDMQPLFITVDPERDTKEVVGKYVQEFSPRILGLTGTVEQVNLVATAFRVYYRAGPKDKDDDYIVDHTIIIYLVDPNGEFVDYYMRGKTREEITASVLSNKRKWELLQEQGWWTSIARKWDAVREAGWFENK